ncbi:MAG: 2,3-bisphosphoglycerate-independent phosphoglycerate mutase [Sulfolobales archaeon]|nr:2,3-bisphosphoglycerate-independent phosphoglycerate mutase [Sulfolobales archaeon]
MFRVILIVGDGMADRPVKELGGRTPLEVAYKPHINELARNSVLGIWDPISPGVRPGSDTSHLSLFGYDPRRYYSGRGPFEALGVGADIKPGDVALRGNFATVDDDLIVLDRRAGRTLPENQELVKYLNDNIGFVDGVEVKFYSATEHRVAVVLRGFALSSDISDTDPHEVRAKVLSSKPLSNDENAVRTADIVNKLTLMTYKLLKGHPINEARVKKGLPPANIILFRGAGSISYIPKLQEREDIIVNRCLAVSATAMIKGVCRLVGFEVVTPSGATGGVDTNVISKAEEVLKAYRNGYDFIYFHLKGTDAASHDGNVRAKIEMIEKLDRAVGHLLSNLDLTSTVLAITSDHTTPTSVKDHTGDPVPVMIYSPELIGDGISDFSERSARKGSLSRIRGSDLMYTILDYANRVNKFGA